MPAAGPEKGILIISSHQIEDDIDKKSVKIGTVLHKIRTGAIQNVRDSETNLKKNEEELKTRLTIWAMAAYVFFAVISAVILSVFILFARSVTRPLRNIMKELRAGADQVSGAAHEMSSAGQSLASGSSEQAASIEEMSATLEEMSAMGRETATLTDGVEKLMNKNIEKSAKSLKAIVDLTRKMDSIEADSDKIGQIIKTIDEIAFQTNLLALNAAVEAARAGETGAGFAVVADEVRNLAIRATEAADTTQALLDRTVKDIKDSAKSVKSVNKDFDAIIESATVIGEKTSSITKASQDVAEAIQQLGESISQIDDVTQRTAATARESATASRQLNVQAEEMNVHVDMLHTIIHGKKRVAGKPLRIGPGAHPQQKIGHDPDSDATT
ncbi:methyl-accepting chemotaxis protein [Thermodesulfobacteriota bacterium]